MPACIQHHVQVVQPVDHFGHKLRLEKRLPARKGDPAFIRPQQGGLLVQQGSQFSGLIFPAGQPFAGWAANYLRLDGLALGIVAPHAGQRAAFQKDGGADAGAVMDGKFFYVKNDARGHTNTSSQSQIVKKRRLADNTSQCVSGAVGRRFGFQPAHQIIL